MLSFPCQSLGEMTEHSTESEEEKLVILCFPELEETLGIDFEIYGKVQAERENS